MFPDVESIANLSTKEFTAPGTKKYNSYVFTSVSLNIFM